MKTKILFMVMCIVLALPFSAIADENEIEIQLLEVMSGGIGGDDQLDGSRQSGNVPTVPTDFHAYVSGRNLTVTSEAVSVTRVIVRNRVTNQTVVNRQFLTIDTEQLSAGAYSIELQCENLTLVGQFDAE